MPARRWTYPWPLRRYAQMLALGSVLLLVSPPAEAGLFSALAKLGKVASTAGKAGKAASTVGKAATTAKAAAKTAQAAKVLGVGTKVGLTALAADRSLLFLASLPDDVAHGAAVLARTDDGLQVFTSGGHYSVAGTLDETLAAARSNGSPVSQLYVDASAIDDVPSQLPTGVSQAYVTDVAGGAHALSRAEDGRWWVEADGGDMLDLAELAAELVPTEEEPVYAESDPGDTEDPVVLVSTILGASFLILVAVTWRRPTMRPATPEEEEEQRRLRGRSS